MSNCPVCQFELKNINPDSDFIDYSCPACGDFRLTRAALSILPGLIASHDDTIAKISHAIRQMQQNNESPKLDSHTIKKILERSLPKPKEQADLFVRWLGENIKDPGEILEINNEIHKSIIGAKTDNGFGLVLTHLLDVGLIIGRRMGKIDGSVVVSVQDATLSFEGWVL